MLRFRPACLGLLLPLLLAFPASGASLVIDFESFVDGELLTSQLPGYAFSNTIIYTSAITLNEIDFPPRSGGNVASDFGGPITLLLDSPITSLSAYFTYLTSVTLTAFDALNNPVATASSLFANNIGTGGDVGSAPNELLEVTFVAGFASVIISGDPGGGSFVFDDLTLTDLEGSSEVPEPGTIWLAATVLSAMAGRRRRAA